MKKEVDAILLDLQERLIVHDEERDAVRRDQLKDINIKKLKQQAAANDNAAMHQLAECYVYGAGVYQNFLAAAHLYAASHRGYIQAGFDARSDCKASFQDKEEAEKPLYNLFALVARSMKDRTFLYYNKLHFNESSEGRLSMSDIFDAIAKTDITPYVK